MDNKSILIRAGTALALIVALGAALPLIYGAFLSTLGLVGIGITGALGIGFVKAIPLLGQKWENKILALRKAEARRNPIEQLQQGLLFKAGQLRAFEAGLKAIGAQIGSLDESLKDQKRKDPDDDLTDQFAALQKMQAFYAKKKQTYSIALKAFEDYKKAIDRAKFKYGFGTAAQGIAAAMNDQDAAALMNNMLADEAFSSVSQTYNAAFSALDIDSMELSGAKQIEFGSGLTINAQAIRIPTPVEIPR